MTVNEAIEVIEEFCEDLWLCDIPIYDNEQEAFEMLIKAALEYEKGSK